MEIIQNNGLFFAIFFYTFLFFYLGSSIFDLRFFFVALFFFSVLSAWLSAPIPVITLHNYKTTNLLLLLALLLLLSLPFFGMAPRGEMVPACLLPENANIYSPSLWSHLTSTFRPNSVLRSRNLSRSFLEQQQLMLLCFVCQCFRALAWWIRYSCLLFIWTIMSCCSFAVWDLHSLI